jgi:hypothetical protein
LVQYPPQRQRKQPLASNCDDDSSGNNARGHHASLLQRREAVDVAPTE